MAFMDLMGLEEAHRGFVEQYQALCIFTRGTGGVVELVVPTGGVLQKFNRGVGGLHHVAFEVNDLQELAEELSKKGVKLLEAQPVRGSGRFLCNFLSPTYTRGLTVEFVQELDEA